MFSAPFIADAFFDHIRYSRYINVYKSLKYISILPRNCGIPDPSWSEIRHFVSFLNSQLRDCEQSFFCDMKLMRAILAGPDVLNLEGFRSFVVRFMIQMSRVSVFLLTYKT